MLDVQLVNCKRCNRAVKATEINPRNPFKFKYACNKCISDRLDVERNKAYNSTEKIRKNEVKRILRGGINTIEMMQELREIKESRGCESKQCKWIGELKYKMLEFHHIGKKIFNIGMFSKVAGWTRQMVLDEVSKCQVLCRNCHSLAKNREKYE